MKKKHALIAVSDKSHLVSFGRDLIELGFTIISTGETAGVFRQAGVSHVPVSSFVGMPEILEGRVKTLHMRICAGILFDPSSEVQRQEAEHYGISVISLVAVNFYPLCSEAVSIDIGGPTLLRSAAKNWRHVTAVCDPADYKQVIATLHQNMDGSNYRHHLACKVFRYTADYDARVYAELSADVSMPLLLRRQKQLRYGENPHQEAGLYVATEPNACGAIQPVQGKELSYNNLLDLNAGVRLVQEFSEETAVIIKHQNPCGVASGKATEVFRQARDSDVRSAFGGVVVLNFICNEEVATEIVADFYTAVVAPYFSSAALAVLAHKKNLQVIPVPWMSSVYQDHEIRTLTGAYLIQQLPRNDIDHSDWRVVTDTRPETYSDLLFALRVAKHVKSNAVVLAKNKQTRAIGGGQTSRIDAFTLALNRATELEQNLDGSALASDGFFPFADWVASAAQAGVTAVVQPGGARRDADSITACNERGISMVFTAVRNFSH